jgi:hypothetical protein
MPNLQSCLCKSAHVSQAKSHKQFAQTYALTFFTTGGGQQLRSVSFWHKSC